MRRTLVFARREVEISLSERTLLVAIAIQVFVAGFSSFLVVGLASLVDPSVLPGSPEIVVAYQGEDDGLYRALLAHGVRPRLDLTNESAERAFHQGVVDAIVRVTEPQPWNGTRPIRVEVTLPEGNLRSTFTMATLKEVLVDYETSVRAERADRLTVHPREMAQVDLPQGASFSFIYGLLIPLLVFLPVVLAGALVADSFTEEVQRGTLGLLLSTPATLAEVVGGKLLANALFAPFLAAIWLALLAVNGIAISGALPILLLVSAAVVILGALACLVGLLTGDRHKAHLVYALVLFLLIAASGLLPQSPVNLVARFASDSADALSHALLAGAIALSGLVLAATLALLKHRGIALLHRSGEARAEPSSREKRI